MALPTPTEHQDQVAVIQWWESFSSSKELDLRLLFAVPNAGAGAQRGQAGKMKAEGVRPGVPDLFLALPMPSQANPGAMIFAGLFIELKRQGWKPPKSGAALAHWQTQRSIHAMLRRNSYNVIVAVGYDETVTAITSYCERALR